MIRGYAGNSRAKGFYLEASLPVTYKKDYPLNYGLISSTHIFMGINTKNALKSRSPQWAVD